MVSGALILNSNGERTCKWCIQRILRILKVLVLWNLLFVAFDILRYRSFVNPFHYMIAALKTDGFLFHFGYLWALIFLYCLTPVLRKAFINVKSSKYITIVILCLLFLIALFNVWATLCGKARIESLVPQVLRFWVYIGYYWMGGILYRNKDEYKKVFEEHKEVAFFCLFVYSINCAVFEYLYCVKFIKSHAPENLFTNPFIIIWCILVFVVITSISYSEKFSEGVSRIIKLSLGVYITHPFLITLMTHMGIWEMTNWGFNFIVVLSGAVVVSFIANRIPIVRNMMKL